MSIRTFNRLLLLVSITLILGACSSSDDDDDNSQSIPEDYPTLSSIAGYQDWTVLASRTEDSSAHPASVVTINQDQAEVAPVGSLVFPLPDGTIVVKESQNDLIAIMEKRAGSNSEHNDWIFVEYNTSGALIGQDGSCWGCHSGAAERDYVFSDF